VPVFELQEGGGFLGPVDFVYLRQRLYIREWKGTLQAAEQEAKDRARELAPLPGGSVYMLFDQDNLAGRRLSVLFTRPAEDALQFGVNLVKLTGGAPDDGWVDADYADVEAHMDTLWNTLKVFYKTPTVAGGYTLSEYRWHRWGVGVGRPNPQVRDILRNVPGTSASGVELPPQVAISVTFKTSRRRSWGRAYLPGPVSDDVTPAQHIDPGVVDTFRTAWGTFADAMKANGHPMVVWCPRVAGAPPIIVGGHQQVPDASSFALTVDQIQVDDVYDTVRRRRTKHGIYRSTHALP
jgi:hypothetical protein